MWSYCGQEVVNIAIIGYKNLLAYAQQQIDKILQPHQKYARAYLDDIVIFSKLLEEHLKHLYNVFHELIITKIILPPIKSFLAYPLVYLFGQGFNALGMATAEANLATITQLAFPHLLKDLKAYLRLTRYLRQYIPYYAQVARPF